MALAVLANTQTTINQLLNRNRLAYSASGGTGANAIGAFKFDAEITDALIRADALVVTECYFQSANLSLRKRFLTASSNLANGAQLPEFQGLIGKAEYSVDGTTWQASEEQLSKSDIDGAVSRGEYSRQ